MSNHINIGFPLTKKVQNNECILLFPACSAGVVGSVKRHAVSLVSTVPAVSNERHLHECSPAPGFILKLQCIKPDKHISQIAEYPQVIILQTILRYRRFSAGEKEFCFFSSPAARDSASTYIRSSVLNMIYNLPKDSCSVAVITFPYIHFIDWKWWHLFDLNRSEDPHRQITASTPFPTFTPISCFLQVVV